MKRSERLDDRLESAVGCRAAATIGAMAGIEPLVDELERSYTELQARLSDPAVYNDHREAADVGRRLKELETPYKLAVAWQEARADLADVRNDPELASMAGGSRERHRAARGGAQGGARRARPGRLEGRDRRDPPGRGRGRGGALGRRRLPDAHAATRSGAASRRRSCPRTRARPAASRRSSSPSRATVRSRSTSTRAARTVSSACPRPSRRAGSTRRPRRSP